MKNGFFSQIRQFVAACGVLLLCFAPVLAHAQDATGGTAQTTGSIQDKTGLTATGGAAFQTSAPDEFTVVGMIGTVIGVIVSFLGILLLYYFIFAGYTWMMSQGNSEKIGEAKKMMVNAVIGMMITIASYALANFILDIIMNQIAK